MPAEMHLQELELVARQNETAVAIDALRLLLAQAPPHGVRQLARDSREGRASAPERFDEALVEERVEG
jgi:hypothetical protein